MEKPPKTKRIATFIFITLANILLARFAALTLSNVLGVVTFYFAVAFMIAFALWFGVWGAIAAYIGVLSWLWNSCRLAFLCLPLLVTCRPLASSTSHVSL
jgi:hypothetical protein